jgi:hypothetical protein
MSNFLQKAVVLCIGMALVLPAFAQGDDKDKAVAKLEVNKGVIMTSRGGEYVTGASGEELFKEERIMVTQDASATVVFNDHCKRTYDEPGVYKIDADCKIVAWWGGGTAALIVAGAVGVGVIANNIGNDNNPPISR